MIRWETCNFLAIFVYELNLQMESAPEFPCWRSQLGNDVHLRVNDGKTLGEYVVEYSHNI